MLVIGVLIGLATGLVATIGVYFWQHDQVGNLNQQAKGLKVQVSSLATQLKAACPSGQSVAPQNNPCADYRYTSPRGVTALIFAPTKNAKVSSPVAVIGEIPGSWSFEAQFPAQLKDGNGKTIAQAAAHVLGNWMTDQLVPFSVQLTYQTTESGSGTLVLQRDNPSGLGTNIDSISIPISFK